MSALIALFSSTPSAKFATIVALWMLQLGYRLGLPSCLRSAHIRVQAVKRPPATTSLHSLSPPGLIRLLTSSSFLPSTEFSIIIHTSNSDDDVSIAYGLHTVLCKSSDFFDIICSTNRSTDCVSNTRGFPYERQVKTREFQSEKMRRRAEGNATGKEISSYSMYLTTRM